MRSGSHDQGISEKKYSEALFGYKTVRRCVLINYPITRINGHGGHAARLSQQEPSLEPGQFGTSRNARLSLISASKSHRSSGRADQVSVAHGVHDRFQISGLRQHEAAEVVAGTVEDQFAGQPRGLPRPGSLPVHHSFPDVLSLIA